MLKLSLVKTLAAKVFTILKISKSSVSSHHLLQPKSGGAGTPTKLFPYPGGYTYHTLRNTVLKEQ